MSLIDVSKITNSMQTMLRNDPSLNLLTDVERGEYVNMDPSRTPWCGIYRTEVEYAPRNLGHHSRSWQAQVTIKLVVQAHGTTGAEAEDALEELIQKILTVILGDLTIRREVEMLNSLRVQYSYDENESQTMDFQWAFITLVYEARTGV